MLLRYSPTVLESLVSNVDHQRCEVLLLRGDAPQTQERLRGLIDLAYQTARDRKLYPKAIFIR